MFKSHHFISPQYVQVVEIGQNILSGKEMNFYFSWLVNSINLPPSTKSKELLEAKLELALHLARCLKEYKSMTQYCPIEVNQELDFQYK